MGMDFFNYKDGELYAEDVRLADIAAQVGTPFYCYSAGTLAHHVQVFDEGIGTDIRKKICFAVKSNSNLAVIHTLSQAGAGADVVSGGEIRVALAAGVKPENIVFSGVGKTKDEMRFALQQNIFQFNVESLPELEALSEVAQEMDKIAAIAVRVNPDVDAKTHAKISTGKSENKFGIPISGAVAFYAKAAALPNINVQAVSVHIGSQLTDLEPFAQAFARVWELVQQLRAAGHDIRVIDCGGGLGIPYDESAPPVPAAYGEIVREQFKDFDGTLVFEPGRLICGNAGLLVSSVIYVKEGEGKTFLIADAAMNDLMRPSLYEAYHAIVPLKKNPDRSLCMYDVVGPVCETGDTFAKGRKLREIRAGEMFAFRSSGAYGSSMSSTYNSRPLIPEVLVKGDQWQVVRPRQSYEEMLGGQVLPQWK